MHIFLSTSQWYQCVSVRQLFTPYHTIHPILPQICSWGFLLYSIHYTAYTLYSSIHRPSVLRYPQPCTHVTSPHADGRVDTCIHDSITAVPQLYVVTWSWRMCVDPATEGDTKVGVRSLLRRLAAELGVRAQPLEPKPYSIPRCISVCVFCGIKL